MAYLIEKLWLDPMENRVAHRWEVKGVVDTLEEAERIKRSQKYKVSEWRWPLEELVEYDEVDYYTDEKDHEEYVYGYKFTELDDLSIILEDELEQLLEIGVQ